MRACVDCGKPFTDKDSKLRVRCAECQLVHKRKITKERIAIRREEEEQKQNKKHAIAEIQREAAAKGMSYGQYVAKYGA